MTASELNQHLNGLWPELDLEKTVDRVIAGPADQVVEGIAVCWMPYSELLIKAKEMGCNVVVAHEPTFFDHFELKKSVGHPRFEAAKEAKSQLIESLGITVLRCHDVWDAIDEIGVPFQWAKFLGLNQPVVVQRYLQVHEISPVSAWEFAQSIAQCTSKVGQSTLQFYGDRDRIVSRVGIGTGCCSEAMALYDLGAELAITVDDIARSWIVGEYCQDSGDPLVVVNHGVAEACAMGALVEKLKSICPGIPILEIPQGTSYREVRA